MKFRLEKQIEYVLGSNESLDVDKRVVYRLLREKQTRYFFGTTKQWVNLSWEEIKFKEGVLEYIAKYTHDYYGITTLTTEQEVDKIFVEYYTNYAKSYAKIHSEGSTVELLWAMEF